MLCLLLRALRLLPRRVLLAGCCCCRCGLCCCRLFCAVACACCRRCRCCFWWPLCLSQQLRVPERLQQAQQGSLQRCQGLQGGARRGGPVKGKLKTWLWQHSQVPLAGREPPAPHASLARPEPAPAADTALRMRLDAQPGRRVARCARGAGRGGAGRGGAGRGKARETRAAPRPLIRGPQY